MQMGSGAAAGITAIVTMAGGMAIAVAGAAGAGSGVATVVGAAALGALGFGVAVAAAVGMNGSRSVIGDELGEPPGVLQKHGKKGDGVRRQAHELTWAHKSGLCFCDRSCSS